MNLIRTKSVTYALCAFVAAGLLAACSSGGTQPAAPSSGFGMNSSVSHVQLPAHRDLRNLYIGAIRHGWTRPYFHPDHSKTWIKQDMVQNAPRLLFAGDAGTGDVYILRMPLMTQAGKITGFVNPEGECSDRNGNIYIADEGAENVYKYSRQGSLISVYNDSAYGLPWSCAVDPSTGNVAVTNVFSPGGGMGNVAIFSSPSSTPTILQNPGQFVYTFAGYDPSGNLWVDGLDSTLSNFILSYCGASSCSTIPISNGTIYGPGAVQWDRVRSTWVVFDADCNNVQSACSYPVNIVSSSGELGTATYYLNDKGTDIACDIPQGVVAADHGNRYAAGGDEETACGGGPNVFARWAYPGGGLPTNHTIFNDFTTPSGAAISNKNK